MQHVGAHSTRASSLQVDRVHKGGSFGRRTSVRGRFDVDLLGFVNGLDTGDREQVEALLHKVCVMFR